MGCQFCRDKDAISSVDRLSELQEPLNPRAFVPERVNAEINNRYIIDNDRQSSGGFGTVFIAEDRAIRGRWVAIKKLPTRDNASKAAFQQEAQLMMTLDHPHICKLFETYDQGKHMYLVMEYLEGGEVFDRIAEEGELSEDLSCSIARQTASALKYAHTMGIAHRDLKPENLCICSDDPASNQIKVIDWGVAHYFGAGPMKSFVGSVTYAAPEVMDPKLSREGYTPACDLWSLGVTSYIMLSGRPPFWGSQKEQLSNMKKEKYPMSSPEWKCVSGFAKDFIRGLLKADPDRRLTIDDALDHPWLRGGAESPDLKSSASVMTTLQRSASGSRLFSICASQVARQLDANSLQELTKVFNSMDTNGDGVLELSEVRRGFEKVFGKNSAKLRDVERTFGLIDLDGSGAIDYSEFCAAGLAPSISQEDDLMKVAFKAFDVEQDDGRITKTEMEHVLRKMGMGKEKAREVYAQVDEIFSSFDKDGDGSIDFEEWKQLVKQSYQGQRKRDHGYCLSSIRENSGFSLR